MIITITLYGIYVCFKPLQSHDNRDINIQKKTPFHLHYHRSVNQVALPLNFFKASKSETM